MYYDFKYDIIIEYLCILDYVMNSLRLTYIHCCFYPNFAKAGGPLGIDVLTLLQKGTKTGNRRRIIDLATPAGFNQHDFEEYFLKACLATNLAFNCSNNLAFHRVFKYIHPRVEIPSPTTLTRHLKWLGKSTVDDI